jgi:hypothetical protein
MRRGSVLIGIAALGVPVLAAGLVWFQPWQLWMDHRVDEQLPDVALARPRGTVSVVLQPRGRRILAIANLDTSNGPDVRVWLTDAKVGTGSSSLHVFDDGEHVGLGRLKGNLGNHVYVIPAAADLTRLTSVTIWCDRFDVSFGAAELTPSRYPS